MTLLHELKNDLTEAAVKLLEQAFHSFSGDNISVLLTRFESGEPKERRFRRFEVTPEGHVVSKEGANADLTGKTEEESIELHKGPMKAAAEGPITL
ncbi:hypothetical protein, conserved [Eimeria necatrix]|uniref:Uncharacterized protein n=1 Tax=Eimeria necatrix TaxID=51315 RepID=U6MZU2_9EIME|nr:hypothetical protein, conserved [Eimeria necatrix]CDJ69753.1 hypothetical protein, conserved [Eimeria necatrix]